MRDAHLHLEATLRLRLASAEPGAERRPPAQLLESVLLDCARDLAVAGAGEAAVRFNPVAWARRGVPLDAQGDVLAAARRRARADQGVELALWVSLKRDARAADLGAATDFAVSARGCGVVGVDVSRSYEVAVANSRPGRGLPPRALGAALARADGAGLELAVHCGWYDGPAQLVEALKFGASRIGHATPLAERPQLVAELAARGTTIELCPTAFERRSGRSLCSLPLARWRDAGVRIEVGSDHPLALGTDIALERRRLKAALPGWSPSARFARRSA